MPFRVLLERNVPGGGNVGMAQAPGNASPLCGGRAYPEEAAPSEGGPEGRSSHVAGDAREWAPYSAGDEAADRTLFLRAVEKFPSGSPQEKDPSARISTLGDLCPFLEATMSDRKGKKERKQKKGAGIMKGLLSEARRNKTEGDRVTREKQARAHSPVSASDGETHGDETYSSMEEALSPFASEKEIRAFYTAMDGAKPLKKGGRGVVPVHKNTPPPAESDAFSALLTGRLEFELLCRDEYLEGHIAGLDQMTVEKLRAGAFSPEAHIDLHGCTAVQAFEALRSFIKDAWLRGLRTLLVIPGRGRNSFDGIGILRAKLQLWLTQEPLKRVVLAFCTAQPQDGGPGSVYVLLRKNRKKGRIFWERLPLDEDLYD
ncbi:MAG: Smr/MutS family protein [Desulfovibrio sp.]|nr:Smr/MutS family protein [Desulfovibrio sp.]